MTAPTANLINAITLIVLSLWGFVEIGLSSTTALIPAAAGVLLLACQRGVKEDNKIMAHLAVLITLALLLALLIPLGSALRADYEAPLALLRMGLMVASCGLALLAFARSFIAARNAR